MYISEGSQLPLLQGEVFGIDLEYSNHRLCLIQISDGKDVFILDPLSIDLKEYLETFFTNQAVKVFFSGQQDIQWLHQEYGIRVNNFCDLKVLAQKEPDSSLTALWKKYCNVNFLREQKKVLQKSDWHQRPLSKEQLEYAALDCKYLVQLREILLAQFTPEEREKIKFDQDLKTPKFQIYIEQQLQKQKLDESLSRNLYLHIKFDQPLENQTPQLLELVKKLKTKHYSTWKQIKQERFQKFQEQFTCHRPVYSNCKIYSKEGIQLCYCDEKKMLWYLKNGLAEQIDPKTIKLTFEPKFNYDEKEMRFYNEERGNICVVCGSNQNYLKYSVVPHLYKHHLPVQYKSHRAHDVVVLCARCHEKTSAQLDKMKLQVSKQFGVPINCYGEEKEIHDRLSYIIKKMQNLQRHNVNLDIMGDYVNIKEQAKLSEVPNLEEMIKVRDELQKQLKNRHGELVVSQLDTEEKIEDFIKEFRKFFLESMNPQFLPQQWAIDHQFKRNFGEKSIYYKQQQQQIDPQ